MVPQSLGSCQGIEDVLCGACKKQLWYFLCHGAAVAGTEPCGVPSSVWFHLVPLCSPSAQKSKQEETVFSSPGLNAQALK